MTLNQLDEAIQDTDDTPSTSGFQLHLQNFSGPFDLLLSLIARKQLDVTEVALAEVTDEFLAYVRTLDTTDEVLEQSTSFMVVAATLLDLKTARLLPAGFSDPEEELALLEERDLLFARLLQYKAFKEASQMMTGRMAEESARCPRNTGPEMSADLLPELVFTLTGDDLAAIVTELLSKPTEEEDPTVGVDHLHRAQVSVTEQVSIMSRRLVNADGQTLTFAELIADTDSVLVVVARFLGVLELYRDRFIGLDQPEPLGPIQVSWQPAEGAVYRGSDIIAATVPQESEA